MPLIERIVADTPKSQTDLSLAMRRAEKAFDNVRSARILLKTNDPERWQISPVIVPLLPLEKLQELQRWLAASSDDADAVIDQASASDELAAGVETP